MKKETYQLERALVCNAYAVAYVLGSIYAIMVHFQPAPIIFYVIRVVEIILVVVYGFIGTHVTLHPISPGRSSTLTAILGPMIVVGIIAIIPLFRYEIVTEIIFGVLTIIFIYSYYSFQNLQFDQTENSLEQKKRVDGTMLR